MLLTKKNIWHGLLFVAVGLFMLGGYFAIGDEVYRDSFHLGPLVAVALMGFGAFLLWRGEALLERDSELIEYYDAIVMAVGIALLVRTFVVEPFKIPSGSMIPTLLVGDYLFVNKSAYGYRVPFTTLRVFMGPGPARGDVMVFRYPPDPSKDYIKRVIAVPGDHLVFDHRRITLNGKTLRQEPDGGYQFSDQRGLRLEALKFREHMEDRSFPVLYAPQEYLAPRVELTVPAGHYFVMGDNRDNSSDSRAWGLVPASHLVGRAVGIFWSWDGQGDCLPMGCLRTERLGQPVE